MAETAADATEALREMLIETGAVMRDTPYPLHFGDTGREYRLARAGCGVAAPFGSAMLTMNGEDRVRFLQGLVTCDVQAMEKGQTAYGYFTSAQGKVLADVVVLAGEDRLDLVVPSSVADELVEHAHKYVIMDRVEVRRRDDLGVLLLIGPRSGDALRQTGIQMGSSSGSIEHGEGFCLGVDVQWATDRRRGVAAWALWAEVDRLPGLFQELAATAAISPVGEEALEVLRVEAGIPRFGKEFDPQALPQEIGNEAAISYSKGCYLGQEVVARIHYRGKVNRMLRGLLLSGPPVPSGTELLAQEEDRAVGSLGSCVVSPRAERSIGLALLHHRGGEPGAKLRLPGGETAEAVALPFSFPGGSDGEG